jgi:hypothetical protein
VEVEWIDGQFGVDCIAARYGFADADIVFGEFLNA